MAELAHDAAPPADDLNLDRPLVYGGHLARWNGTSARVLARRQPTIARWCAENRADSVGLLCALALLVRAGTEAAP